jgi:hypothetical protein
MHCIDLILQTQSNNALDVQIRSNRLACLSYLIGLVRLKAMQGKSIFVRINRYGPNLQLVRTSKNTCRDLAAVRREQLSNLGHGFGREREEGEV